MYREVLNVSFLEDGDRRARMFVCAHNPSAFRFLANSNSRQARRDPNMTGQIARSTQALPSSEGVIEIALHRSLPLVPSPLVNGPRLMESRKVLHAHVLQSSHTFLFFGVLHLADAPNEYFRLAEPLVSFFFRFVGREHSACGRSRTYGSCSMAKKALLSPARGGKSYRCQVSSAGGVPPAPRPSSKVNISILGGFVAWLDQQDPFLVHRTSIFCAYHEASSGSGSVATKEAFLARKCGTRNRYVYLVVDGRARF